MSKKPHILLINDDGIHAPGLKALSEALAPLANLTIVAPSEEQSGVGVSVTLRRPLMIDTIAWDNETSAWHVNGTPADCVRMALNVICQERPDLVASGINIGTNSGRNVFFSGTVGGVIDAALHGIPGVAFSCQDFKNPNYEAAKIPLQKIVAHLLENPLPKGRILNVTFPENHRGKGIKLARQGLGYMRENIIKGTHPLGKTYYWTGGIIEACEEDETSDNTWLERGYITAVPLNVNDLTDHRYFTENQRQFESLFESEELISQ